MTKFKTNRRTTVGCRVKHGVCNWAPKSAEATAGAAGVAGVRRLRLRVLRSAQRGSRLEDELRCEAPEAMVLLGDDLVRVVLQGVLEGNALPVEEVSRA